MAARGVNKVILLGNVGQEPEVRYAPSGKTMATLNIATSERWQDKNTQQPQERTEWHRVVLFGKTAEIAAEYLKKGHQVYIEGKLQTRKWQDQQGQDRYTTEIVVDRSGSMQLLTNRSEQHQASLTPPSNVVPLSQPKTTPAPSQPLQQPRQDFIDDFDDDIPF